MSFQPLKGGGFKVLFFSAEVIWPFLYSSKLHSEASAHLAGVRVMKNGNYVDLTKELNNSKSRT